MGPRKPCSIGKALGKQTDLLSPMSAKNLLLSVPGAWCVHPMYTTHAHNRCLREMHLTFFSVAHFHQCTMTMDCEWQCVIESAAFHVECPFRPETLHSTAFTETSTHIWGYWARSTPAWSGAGVPCVPLKQKAGISTGDRWNWGNVGRSLKTPSLKSHAHPKPANSSAF